MSIRQARRRIRRVFRWGAAVWMLMAMAAVWPGAQEEAGGRPVVYATEVEALIHPVSAEYISQTLDEADRAGADLVVVMLRTPGGLVDSHARDQHPDHRGGDAGRRLRRPERHPRRVGGLPDHHRRRRGGHGAGHAHRRRAPGLRHRLRDGRNRGREGGLGRGGVCAVAGEPAATQRRAGREGGHREPVVHGTRSPRGGAAADRPHRLGSRRPARAARRPRGAPLGRQRRGRANGGTRRSRPLR